jgi:signal transduction histidine kinase
LQVSVRPTGGNVTVSFEDKGPGIAPEALQHIFEARVSTCTRGSGLGLAIAKQIVEQHGGRIRGRSQPGQGACFEISLPLAPREDLSA